MSKPETGKFKIHVESDNPAEQVAEVSRKLDGALLKFKKQHLSKKNQKQWEQSLMLRSINGRTLTYELELKEWEGLTITGLGKIINIHQWADCKALMDERIENREQAKKKKQAEVGDKK